MNNKQSKRRSHSKRSRRFLETWRLYIGRKFPVMKTKKSLQMMQRLSNKPRNKQQQTLKLSTFQEWTMTKIWKWQECTQNQPQTNSKLQE